MPKVVKPASPTTEGNNGKNTASTKVQQFDVRTIALQLFLDRIIYPIFPTLHDCLTEMKDQFIGGDVGYKQPRLQQMYALFMSRLAHINSSFIY